MKLKRVSFGSPISCYEQNTWIEQENYQITKKQTKIHLYILISA